MNALIRSLATDTYPDLQEPSVGVAVVGEGDHPRAYLQSICRCLWRRALPREAAASASPQPAAASAPSPRPALPAGGSLQAALAGRLGPHGYLLPGFGRPFQSVDPDSLGPLQSPR